MAKVFKITGEEPFQIEAHSFAISPSVEGYTIHFSADGVNFSSSDQVPANTNWGIACPRGVFIKLVGNESEVTVTY